MKLKQFTLSVILIFFFTKNISAEFSTNPFSKISEEECYNGIDDDGDGLIDLADPDCFCEEAFYLDQTNLITNPSFTHTNSGCPPTFSGCYALNTMQQGCVDSWLVVDESFYGLDYFTKCYSNNHSLTWPPSDIYLPDDEAFMEVVTLHYSSPNPLVGGNSPLIGGTLIAPLIVGETYEFKVYLNPFIFDGYTADVDPLIPISVTHTLKFSLYGHVSENNFPYSVNISNCPTNLFPDDYIELGSSELTTASNHTWKELSIQFEATQSVSRFAFGVDCLQNTISGFTSYGLSTLMDSFKLQQVLPVVDSTSLVVDVSDAGVPCANETTLQTTSIGGGTYQWYYNNVEIPGADDAVFSFENDLDNNGIYFVQVIDTNGICGMSDSIEVIVEDPFEVTDYVFNVECFGGNNGAINLDINNSEGLSFNWIDEQGNSISDNQNIENLNIGNYLLEIIEDDSCTYHYDFEITQPEEILLSADVLNIPCEEGELGHIAVSSTGGIPDYSYSVDGINFSTDSNFELPSGNYEITVLDNNLCEQTLSNVIIDELEEYLFEIIPSAESINPGDSVQMELTSNQPLDEAFIEWTPSGLVDCPSCIIVNSSNLTETTNFQVYVTENGCTRTVEILIYVDDSRKVYIPNSFTPNSDGNNDVFEIYTGIGVEEILSFKIFNRWGAIVFDDPNLGWDGNFKNQPAQSGVYVWKAEIQFLDGVVEVYQGDVTLTRW